MFSGTCKWVFWTWSSLARHELVVVLFLAVAKQALRVLCSGGVEWQPASLSMDRTHLGWCDSRQVLEQCVCLGLLDFEILLMMYHHSKVCLS